MQLDGPTEKSYESRIRIQNTHRNQLRLQFSGVSFSQLVGFNFTPDPNILRVSADKFQGMKIS